MWKAYYRRQPVRLFGLLVLALREQGRAPWPRALASATVPDQGGRRFARSDGDYERVAPDIVRAFACWGCRTVDLDEVARWELRWWVVRREQGLVRARRPAMRSRTCTRRSTACRGTRSPRPAGCAGWRPKRAIEGRTPIPTDRPGRVEPIGRRWRACCARPIGACAGRSTRPPVTGQRSSSRRPTIHQAAREQGGGEASLIASPTTKGQADLDGLAKRDVRTAISQGRPNA